jgi:hypothetical protein
MKLTYLSGDCPEGPCPTIYGNDRGEFVFQGTGPVTEAEGAEPPPSHEARVALPSAVIVEWVASSLSLPTEWVAARLVARADG